ncbi:MAG: hypothetical protein RJB26_1426 [Pseudomonadota bacterium]|jgi:hypothetical protein
MRQSASGTIPVRIDYEIYRHVAKMAVENRRTVRAQLEMLLEERMADLKRLETRGGAK